MIESLVRTLARPEYPTCGRTERVGRDESAIGSRSVRGLFEKGAPTSYVHLPLLSAGTPLYWTHCQLRGVIRRVSESVSDPVMKWPNKGVYGYDTEDKIK
jgi:hypothetical protein